MVINFRNEFHIILFFHTFIEKFPEYKEKDDEKYHTKICMEEFKRQVGRYIRSY